MEFNTSIKQGWKGKRKGDTVVGLQDLHNGNFSIFKQQCPAQKKKKVAT